uniref:Uncharacterized protein n=1 Tax=Siphoviridae sp. ctLeh52 TaxID=2827849 RepID=A0A8S5RWY1_9CAUD|nr:MAG TPA: hypothetical protein [Siphoviridae sp. ctLeh52]
MRVISQDGAIDVPYEISSLSMAVGKYEDVEHAAIYCKNSSTAMGTKMAEYGSKEKAKKAMEMLRDAYVGMPIVMQNVDVSEDVVKQFEKLKNSGIIVQTMNNEPSKVEYVNNCIFQFPKDDEIEVET